MSLESANADFLALCLSRAPKPEPAPKRRPRLAPPDAQGSLLAVKPTYDTSRIATRRNAYGQAAQDIVRAALGVAEIKINGAYDICFDAATLEEPRIYYEIKSVARGSSVVIYKWRLRKERESGAEVHPRIGGHEADPFEIGSRSEIAVVSLETVARLTRGRPLRMPKKPADGARRNGWNREGYRDGYWLVPVSALLSLPGLFQGRAEFELDGIAAWALVICLIALAPRRRPG